jgi:alpha-glucosidase (family GH31 glycosyl hydrolase)
VLKKSLILLMALFSFPVVYSHPDQDSVAKQKAQYKWEARHYVSHHLSNGILNIETDHGLVQAIPYSDKIIEIKNFEKSVPVPDSSVAVIMEPSVTSVNLNEDGKRLYLTVGNLTAVFHKSPFHIAFVYNGDTLLSEEKGFFSRTDNNGLRFRIDREEQLFGLGERAVDFSLRGKKYQLYNQPNYGYQTGAEFLNYSVPMTVSSKRYMLFFDNQEKGYADLGKEDRNVMEWGAIGGLMKYFFIAGDDFRDLAFQWGNLTGKQPLPPLWALGNLQSRMAYKSQKEVDSITALMLAEDFPVDAVILDFYWFGDSIKGYMGRLDWFKPNWPEPQKMIRHFKEKNIKTVLITEPYVINTLENFKIGDSLGIFTFDSTGKTYINQYFYFGPAGLIDIFKPVARQWFWSKYKRLIDQGVAGWWGDLGEPEYHPSDELHVNGSADQVHNIYAHEWHKMLFENYKKEYPEQRLFNLNRAGYAGSQRYGIFPWTGDVSRSWGGLQAQLPALLHASLSGLPYVHSDAGGFAGGQKDDELYTRWLQFACFTPVLRIHGDAVTAAPEPVYYSEKTKNIVRRYIKLRYRLLPYIYSMSAQATIKGYPLMRPLFFEFPDDWETLDTKNEYMFGANILVAPVIKSGERTRTVYLPRGTKWYYYHTNRRYPGGNEYDIPVTISDIPLFIKEGSFIPMVKPVNNTEEFSTEELIIRYYVGNDERRDNYLMYADDGKKPKAIEEGDFETLMFVQKKNEKGLLEFMFSKIKGYDGMPPTRNIKLEIIGLSSKKEAAFALNGKLMKKVKNGSSETGYYFDESRKIWVINFVWDTPDVFVTERVR